MLLRIIGETVAYPGARLLLRGVVAGRHFAGLSKGCVFPPESILSPREEGNVPVNGLADRLFTGVCLGRLSRCMGRGLHIG